MSFFLRKYLIVASDFEAAENRLLGKLARKCAEHYRLTLVLGVLVLGLMAIGMLNFWELSESSELWVDVNGPSMKNRRLVKDTMNQTHTEGYIFLFLAESNDYPRVDDIVTVEHIQTMFDFDHALRAIRTSTNNKSLEEMCQKRLDNPNKCLVGGVLRFWDVEESLFTGSTTDAVKQKMAESIYFDGSTVDRTLDMANFRLIPGESPSKAAADGFSFSYLLKPTKSSPTMAKDIHEFMLEVEKELKKSWPNLQFSMFHSDSIDDALSSVVGRDVILLVIAFTLMIVVASLTLGRPFHKIEGRFLLATQSVLLVVLSSFTGYCFCFAIGLPFTNLQQVLPFLLLGIGIDDAYVVTTALDHTSRKKPIDERIEEAYRTVGVSITVTSLTDIVALLFSLTSRLPAVRYFGVYAAVSVAFIYLGFLTVFAALIKLDEQRRARHALDMIPCYVSKQYEREEYENSKPLKTPTAYLEDALVDYYVPCLLNKYVRIFVILAFLGFTGFMASQVPRIDTAFPLRDLTPSDTAAFKYITTHERLFDGLETPDNGMDLYFQDIDYSSGQVQQNMEEFIQDAGQLALMKPGISPRNWHTAMSQFARNTAPYDTMPRDSSNLYIVGDTNFYSALGAFLNIPLNSFLYGPDLAIDSTTGRIEMSRVAYTTVFITTSQEMVDALNQCRNMEATAGKIFNPKPFFHTGNIMFWEQNSFMVNEAIGLLGLTLASVTIITAMTLVHPTLVLLVTLTLGMIFVCTLGALPLLGVNLNTISVTNLVMGIGIVVDPAAHISHSFGQQDKSLPRDQRVALAMREIGGSVLLGVLTTFIGVLPSAAASSEIFRVFFKSICTIVALGAVHGLVWLPAVLSLMGASFGTNKTAAGNEFSTISPSENQTTPDSSSEGITKTEATSTTTDKNVSQTTSSHLQAIV